jgi:3,4-dihydroxy 2-butanone 4-phosphate synthase / GTP cyclohydrolase II
MQDAPPFVSPRHQIENISQKISLRTFFPFQGVSAVDRALTITALASEKVKYEDFRRPGHVFPLIARDGGVLERRGHTEVTLDLCRLAGLKPVGLLAEIMKPDGTMARLDDCITFAKEHDLPLITVEQVANYRKSLQDGVEFLSECYLPIERQGKFLGKFRTQLFKDPRNGHEHVVLSMGLEGEHAPKPDETILVRIHSECFTGNVLGSIKCDCHHQLDLALEIISREKRGAVIYAGGHEGRGIGLASKLKAYALQDAPHNLDTFAANEALGLPRDSRQYDSAAAILKYLGIHKVNLLTNNKYKYAALLPLVTDVTPLDGRETEFNKDYLKVKRREQAIQQQSSEHPVKSPAPQIVLEQKKSTLPEHPEEAILKGRDGHVKSIPINVR